MRVFLAVATSICFSTGIAVQAQLLTNPVQDYINRTTLLNDILSNSRATGMSQRAQTGTSGSPVAGSPSTSKPDPTKFTRASGFLLPKMLAERSNLGPAQRPQAEQFFVSLIQLYEQTANKDGFPSDDIAYALQYFVVNTYMTLHDLHNVPYEKDPRVKHGKDTFDRLTLLSQKQAMQVTPSQEQAMFQQFKTQLAQVASVQTMTDQQKQELAELLAITFGMNFKSYMDAVNKGDDRLLQQAKQVARGHLEKLTGAPIDKIQIAADGLRTQ